MSAENPKKSNKKKINQIKAKKNDRALQEYNLNGEKSECEFNIKIKKTKHQENSNKAIIKKKKLFVSDIDLKINSKKIMNTKNKKLSENSISINKYKEKYHSFYEIKESSDTQLQISNLEGLFIPNAKTENISLNHLFQEKNSDKNPSEISDKHIDIIRKENLIIIDNAMAKMRGENNLFIKAFSKEMLVNLMLFLKEAKVDLTASLKEGNADLTDRLIASLKESNADLVNKIFEKMNNK